MEPQDVLAQISLEGFLDQVQDGLYVTDRHRRIMFWNRAAEQLTGFAPRDVLGRHCHDPDVLDHRSSLGLPLCTEDDCPVLRALVRGVAGTVPGVVLTGTRSGRPLPVSLSVGPLRGGDGSTIGALVLFREVREEYQQRRLAMEIQRRMITRGRLERGGLRVRSLYEPVDDIGGDFLEAFFLHEGTLAVTVADATGHGISAALFTMVYKTLLHSSVGRSRAPAEILVDINKGFLRTAGVDGFFLSACLAFIDPATLQGRYASAGHPPALLLGPGDGGRVPKARLGGRAPALGITEEAFYADEQFALAPGDLLLLASDGLFEAERGDGSRFGADGIEAFLAGHRGTELLDDLLAHIRSECRYLQLPDDLSMVAVEALPS